MYQIKYIQASSKIWCAPEVACAQICAPRAAFVHGTCAKLAIDSGIKIPYYISCIVYLKK